MKHNIRLKNAVLLMALASAYPLNGFAAAGVAQFSSGDVTLRRGAAADPLVKGRGIESGDAILTGPTGRAQVRFSDGGLVSLQPNSQFNIANYADKNDPKQDAFLVDLLRGGMRAVTGLIGKRNRENFKVTTTTATIGIRGSAFNVAYNADGTLSVSTELDEIEVCTRSGCVGLTAGESALVVSPQEAPVRTSTRASLPTPEPRQEPQVVANQQGILPSKPTYPALLTGMAFTSTSLTGTQPRTALPLVDAPTVVVIGDGDYVFDSATYDHRAFPEGALYLNANGDPEAYYAPGNVTGKNTGTITTVAKSGSLAGGDFMLLGTWSGSTWTEAGESRNLLSTAFVTGLPTPSSGLAALVGQRGDYNLTAATPVFSSNGSTGELLSSSKLTVDFLAAGNYIDVKLDVAMPYTNEQAAQGPSQNIFNLRGSTTASGASFGGNLSVTNAYCVEYGSLCGLGTFSGFLGGNNAGQAGVSFAADAGYAGVLTGAGIFTRGATSATPQNQIYTNLAGAFMAVDQYSDFYYRDYSSFGENYYGTDEAVFNGDQLVKYRMVDSYGQTVERTTAPGTFGALGKVTDSDFIGWGNWVTATSTTTGYYSSSANLDSLHYIIGRPTPQSSMPQSGYANYAMVGGTAPTAHGYNSPSQIGQLLSGYLNVDFYNGSVGTRIATKFGDTVVNINGTAYIVTDSLGNTGRFRTDGCSNVMINGIFTGNQAARAGLVYGKDTDSSLGRVSGAIVFQKISGNPGYAN
jgi:hypothetical protein